MQTLPNCFPWLPGDTIKWPSDDKKLKLVNSWVADVDAAMIHVDNFTTAIQAGGACGIWPGRLACYFKSVYTVEPNADNFACLKQNLKPLKNVTYCRGAFGAFDGFGALARDSFEDGNAGAWYMVHGEEFPVITIDSIGAESVGLIMLDVEGSELEALQGAVRTIQRDKPVVVVEAKQLPHMDMPCTAAGDYLRELGYKQVAKYHNDLVFKC